jgi:hypothetical protein
VEKRRNEVIGTFNDPMTAEDKDIVGQINYKL